MAYETNVAIAPYTSWRVGGKVRYLVKPEHVSEIQVWLAEHRNIPNMMLGLGSNVLFPDEDMDIAVILTRSCMQDFIPQDHGSWIVGAGVSCGKLARTAALSGYRDAAFFCGIPGTLGGALAMNAGAYGGETWQYVDWVDILTFEGALIRYTPQAVQVSYRQVVLPEKGYFVRAQLTFKEYYKESQQPVIAQWLKHRASTQPIGLPSCGSVFKNPYPLYAGALIEGCGLKGYRIGGAEVSKKHANFIINIADASSQNIKDLIAHIQACVIERYAIALVPEVIYIENILGHDTVHLNTV